MKLLIDAGNSRIKWAMTDGKTLNPGGAICCSDGSLKQLLQDSWAGIGTPEAVIVASVAAENIEKLMSSLVSSQWGLEIVFLNTEENGFGISNGYRDHRQMGVDRWLGIIAAANLYGLPICIIDCGTAITADIVNDEGKHVGGYIIPGLELAGGLLTKGTERIGSSRSHDLKPVPGLATDECIINGYLIAVISWITAVENKATEYAENEPVVVITGGSAETVMPYLPERYEYNKDLVLHGLMLAGGH